MRAIARLRNGMESGGENNFGKKRKKSPGKFPRKPDKLASKVGLVKTFLPDRPRGGFHRIASGPASEHDG